MAAMFQMQAVKPAQIQLSSSHSRCGRMSSRPLSSRPSYGHYRKAFIVRSAAEAEDTTTAQAVESGAALSLADTKYSLSFLWLDKNVAVAVDQVIGQQYRSPLTEYFFWPRNDAWEELKAALESKSWIEERDKVLMLNRCTEVINFWQDENKHGMEEAKDKFPDCKFQGNA